ncbi:MAG: hypothetical protein Q9Q40_04155 [Acidobacteriota bacterium]|nr:hypothetical protein [Acidobacteriota bacterium]MDQ7088191.1 hypothetical protein [Acidobacteriota bacterium]
MAGRLSSFPLLRLLVPLARPWIGASVCALAVLAASEGSARAFTPRTRAEIARRALALMPDGLERQLRKHARALFAGALEGLEAEPRPLAALDPGQAPQRLAGAIDRAAQAIEDRRGMEEVARRFGRIARWTADLAFALNVGPDDPREATIYDDFARYAESRLPRMRVVFDGFADPRLAAGETEAFGRWIGERARRDYDGILRSYFPPGRRASPQDFDDRSVAFASASLEVSLAVTATARAWLYTWRLAHGDLHGTPTLNDTQVSAPFQAAPAGGEQTGE